jgi:antitoxin (DNA-binding transcriptional repressor) of toxin-antitoxin stability system
MTRITPEATPRPRPAWQSLLRLPLVGRSLSSPGSVSKIGAPAMLLVGFGMLAVTVDATPDHIGPRWLGRIDDGAPVHEARTAQLLGATAIGWQTELRRVDAGYGGRLRALDEEVRVLGEAQARLAARLRSIEAGEPVELTGVRDALADLTRRQAGIESRLTAAAELAALKGDAPSLDDEVRTLRLVAAALLLREGAQSARPFGPALERFAAIASSVETAYLEADLPPAAAQIASLQPYAESGVISSLDLRRSFASLPGLIERAQPTGWWDSLLIMVGWRDDPLRPLHEAEAALMAGDLEGAVASLAALQGEAGLVAEGWLNLARARLAADVLVDDLYQLALAAGSAPPAAGSALAASAGAKPATRRSSEPVSWKAAQSTIGAGPQVR